MALCFSKSNLASVCGQSRQNVIKLLLIFNYFGLL